MERYYQIARCFRDEDFRADRQPEFTQIDIEMSFVDQDDVIDLGEELIGRIWKEMVGVRAAAAAPADDLADAMARYGSDKPDLRFGLRAGRADRRTSPSTTFRVFQAPYVGAVVMPGGAAQTRKELDGWQDWAKARGARGLAYVLLEPGRRRSAARSPRTSPRPSARAWPTRSGAEPGRRDLLRGRRAVRRAASCSARPAWRSAAAAA